MPAAICILGCGGVGVAVGEPLGFGFGEPSALPCGVGVAVGCCGPSAEPLAGGAGGRGGVGGGGGGGDTGVAQEGGIHAGGPLLAPPPTSPSLVIVAGPAVAEAVGEFAAETSCCSNGGGSEEPSDTCCCCCCCCCCCADCGEEPSAPPPVIDDEGTIPSPSVGVPRPASVSMLLLLSEAAARADADAGIEGGETALEAARASTSEKVRRRGGGEAAVTVLRGAVVGEDALSISLLPLLMVALGTALLADDPIVMLLASSLGATVAASAVVRTTVGCWSAAATRRF